MSLRSIFHRFHCAAALWLCASATLLLAVSSLPAAADDAETYFETNVRPVFVAHCQSCHGEKKQESGLRLDSRDALLKGGDIGPAIVPGKPDESLLIAAIRHTGDVQMPPSKKLTDPQIDAITNWVKSGAAWPNSPATNEEQRAAAHRRHWALQPIANPAPPAVADAKWAKTPIDRFILAKLESSGLPPAPPADRRTLIRRLTYDLTGLPPTPEQVDAFVNDPDPAAFSKLVDRLLDSPQYGEQWARHWLDVARYSDTKGYVYAREERFWVHAPAYRDWVVDAFNRDLPYDRFLLLQIAADQAAPDDPQAAAAMGFLTLGRRFLGVTHDIIDDRIDVVTRGTMGLTAACARCHDHKYDPIPTADYYSLYGVFMNATERLSQIAESPAKDDPGYEAFAKELATRQQKLSETLLAKRNEAADRVRQRIDEYLIAQTELSKYPEEGFDQILATTDVIPTFVRRWEAWLALQDRETDPVFRPWRRFAELKDDEFEAKSPAIIEELNKLSPPINARLLAALSPPPKSMREVAERYGTLLKEADAEWKTAREAAKSAGTPEPAQLDSADAEALRQVLYGHGSPCIVPDEPIVSTETFFDSGSVNELWKLQGEVDRWLIQSPLAPAHAVSLVDRELIRPSRILRRGNPANRGAEVTRHFLSAIDGPNPAPFEHGSGRFELAQDIIDPGNPLTARVWVNRVWQHHFGAGLVRTSSDFGLRADPPSHPKLLDWLATYFVREGWSTKKLHRLICNSNVYQQRSDGPDDPAALAKVKQLDPENRLLSRMNVRRLTFEEYRDTLLSVAGRLDLQMGGRASDLFAGQGTQHNRRTLYGLIDRQFLPTTLRVFDFANPDLHTPTRSETTVPQQALFALNYPFVVQQAQTLVARSETADPAEKIRQLYRAAYQREPTPEQQELALNFIQTGEVTPTPKPSVESLAWQYGYGELDDAAKTLKSFAPLPHFTGSAWQGGANWPDAKLGWVQITATGGHPGNDHQHCCIRRWTAPHDGTYSVTSTASHDVAAGNGVRFWIFSSREGALLTESLHNGQKELNVPSVTLQKGDTLDFVVDINGDLNSDQHLWAPVVSDVSAVAGSAPATPADWKADRDFTTEIPKRLTRWEQLAQVLLIANELMFVD